MTSNVVVKREAVLRAMRDRCWNMTELARQADLSTEAVSRALRGYPIGPKVQGGLMRAFDVEKWSRLFAVRDSREKELA